jgi:hypothetical protein
MDVAERRSWLESVPTGKLTVAEYGQGQLLCDLPEAK